MTQQQANNHESDPPAPFENFKSFTERLLKVKKDELQTQRQEKTTPQKGRNSDE